MGTLQIFPFKGTMSSFQKQPEGGSGEREKERWRRESRKIKIGRQHGRTNDQVFLESQQAMNQILVKLSKKIDVQIEEMKGWAMQKKQTNQPYRTRATTTMEKCTKGRPMGKPITENKLDKDGTEKTRKQMEQKKEKRNKTRLKIASWNIRSGQIRRELELQELLQK